MKYLLHFVMAAAAAAALLTTPAARSADATEAESGPMHHTQAYKCKRCHLDIYRQWEGSMHAKSTALKDPIHGAFYVQTVGDPKEEGVLSKESGKYPVCLNCHAPNAALDKKTKLDAVAAYGEGVNCIVCHSLKQFKGISTPDGKPQYGIAAYETSKTSLMAPSGTYYGPDKPAEGQPLNAAMKPFHPFIREGNAAMRANDACMGCHEQRDNFKGAPLCVTGTEYSKSGSFASCQSCHMPKSNGVTDHSMMGGHSADMVKRSIVMKFDARVEGDRIMASLSLHNRLPHAFPTGAPFRHMVVKVVAYDKDGKPVWQNFKNNPAAEDPQSAFHYVLGNEKDQIAQPPEATKVLANTRLQPNEARQLRYDIPAANVAVVRAQALYNVLAPPLIAKMGDKLPPEMAADKVAASAEFWR